MEEPEPEPAVIHRDQVKFKKAKPKPAAELPPMDHVTIEEDRAKMAQIKQGPAIEQEPFVRRGGGGAEYIWRWNERTDAINV